jgi:hypothetical protein
MRARARAAEHSARGASSPGVHSARPGASATTRSPGRRPQGAHAQGAALQLGALDAPPAAAPDRHSAHARGSTWARANQGQAREQRARARVDPQEHGETGPEPAGNA